MKLKELWKWLTKSGDKNPERPPIEKEDMFGTIKHATRKRYLGIRAMGKHNNRKMTRGRRIQYVEVNGITKPIYHGAK
jgi:hypothetical protein